MKATVLTLLVCGVLVLGSVFLDIVKVDGNSMTPSLCDRDVIVVLSTGHGLLGAQKGRTVVAQAERGQPMLKRVVASGGDRIRIEHGRVILNGDAVEEPYVCANGADYFQTWPYTSTSGAPDTYTVPDGDVFVLGDNRSASSDSRIAGSFPLSRINGLVLARVSGSGACGCSTAPAQSKLAKRN